MRALDLVMTNINIPRREYSKNTVIKTDAVYQEYEQLLSDEQDENPGIQDSVELSSQRTREKEDVFDQRQKKLDDYRFFLEQLRHSTEQTEGAAEGWKIKIKCTMIAMRIMSGDNVPVEDHRYLSKHDIELYCKAISMRVEKEDPYDHDRLSEDEEDKDKETGADDGRDISSISTADVTAATPEASAPESVE